MNNNYHHISPPPYSEQSADIDGQATSKKIKGKKAPRAAGVAAFTSD